MSINSHYSVAVSQSPADEGVCAFISQPYETQ